jgi:hypothetical protein
MVPMKSVFIASMLVTVSWATAFADDTGATAPAGEPPAQDIAVRETGRLDLERIAGKTVYVSFKNSDKLTAALREAAGRIATVTGDEKSAEVVLNVEGAYAARRGLGNRYAAEDAGKLFEEGGKVETKGHLEKPPRCWHDVGGVRNMRNRK